MKKLLLSVIIIAVLVFSMSAMAADVDLRGLTEEQKAMIALEVAKMKEKGESLL